MELSSIKSDKIELIVLDVYGTFLPYDYSNEIEPRKGFYDFISGCKEKNIKIITGSDVDTDSLIADYRRAKIDHSIFDGAVQLIDTPKEFGVILDLWKTPANKSLIIGDSRSKDIFGAQKIRANYIWVPRYTTKNNNFDLSEIKF